MQSAAYSRVILLPDGSSHIAFFDGATIQCTPSSLLALLTKPFLLYEKKMDAYMNTTAKTNPSGLDLENLPGLTLISILQDGTSVCVHPTIYNAFYSAVSAQEVDSPLSIRISQGSISDERELMLYLFLEIGLAMNATDVFDVRYSLAEDKKNAYVTNLINLITDSAARRLNPSVTEGSSHVKSNVSTNPFGVVEPEPVKIPEGYLPVREVAKMRGVYHTTVDKWIEKGKVSNYIKDEKGNYYLDPNEEVIDLRAGRKTKTDKKTGRKYKTLQDKSYAGVQKHIAERALVTDAIRPYIFDYEEARFYEKNHYHEVCWGDDLHALIIDIVPEFTCPFAGKSNRQLIEEGLAPFVPGVGPEYPRFHLHHIGQRKTSPLAIINESIHNSTEYYSIFHSAPKSNEDLHDKEFEDRKKRFWRKYLEMYDEHKTFRKIPYLNPKHLRNKEEKKDES